jgi:hypothetical protein
MRRRNVATILRIAKRISIMIRKRMEMRKKRVKWKTGR